MKKVMLSAVAVVAMIFVGCEDSPTASSAAQPFLGTWSTSFRDSGGVGTMSIAFEEPNKLGIVTSLDTVYDDEGNAIFGTALDAMLSLAEIENPMTMTGTWRNSSDTLFTTIDGTSDTVVYRIDGKTITLNANDGETITAVKQ